MAYTYSFPTSEGRAAAFTIPVFTPVGGTTLVLELSHNSFDFSPLVTNTAATVTAAGNSVVVSLSSADVSSFKSGFYRVKSNGNVLVSGSIEYQGAPVVNAGGGGGAGIDAAAVDARIDAKVAALTLTSAPTVDTKIAAALAAVGLVAPAPVVKSHRLYMPFGAANTITVSNRITLVDQNVSVTPRNITWPIPLPVADYEVTAFIEGDAADDELVTIVTNKTVDGCSVAFRINPNAASPIPACNGGVTVVLSAVWTDTANYAALASPVTKAGGYTIPAGGLPKFCGTPIVTVTWPSALPNANYNVKANLNDGSDAAGTKVAVVGILSRTKNSAQVVLAPGSGAGASGLSAGAVIDFTAE